MATVRGISIFNLILAWFCILCSPVFSFDGGYEFRTHTTCEGPHYSLNDSTALLLESTIDHCNSNEGCSMVVAHNCDEPDLKFFYCINGTPAFSSTACSWIKNEVTPITSTATTTTISGDNLLVIGGAIGAIDRLSTWGKNVSTTSDVELVNFKSNDDGCYQPNFDYPIYAHATVTSSRGVITCGGSTKYQKSYQHDIPKCVIQSQGETRAFPSMVLKRYSFTMINVNDILYSIGGERSQFTMETINVINGTEWKKQELPYGIEDHCVATIRSKIYVIGGKNNTAEGDDRYLPNPMDRVMIYDVNDKQWSEGPSLNIKRFQHSCMVDRKTETIHVMGGRGELRGGNILVSTETFDVANQKWILGPNLKEPSYQSAAVSSNSNDYVGYLVGGYTDVFVTTPHIWGLHRSKMEWIKMSKTLKIPRTGHSVVNVKSSDIGC